MRPRRHCCQWSRVIDLETAQRLANTFWCNATVVITLGARGSLLIRRGEVRHFPAFAVTAVDSTAAGDAFNGALAAALLAGLPLEQAIVRANAAGALCVTKRGAQESLPTQQEIDALVHTTYPGA